MFREENSLAGTGGWERRRDSLSKGSKVGSRLASLSENEDKLLSREVGQRGPRGPDHLVKHVSFTQ